MTYPHDENQNQPQNNKRDNSIAIFWQPDAEGTNKPHFTGFVTVAGVDYELAVWPAKSGKAGAYSGQIKPKGARQ